MARNASVRGRRISGNNPLDVPAALRFLRALRRHNDRAWFEQNRAEYDARIKPQWEDFVAALLVAGTRFEPRFADVDPRACIFRLARDIRFARDKTPYKTYLSAFLSPRGWRGSTPGFWISLEPGGESEISAGIYVPERPVLTAIRRRLAAGDRDFARIVDAKRMAPYVPLRTAPLKTVPRGFPRNHPRAGLIRAQRYMAGRDFTDRELTAGNAFAIFRNAMRDTAPLVQWLARFTSESAPLVGDAFEPFDA
ncbi:MAG: DUF2461 domain-containing protein [Candidatus Velthaea sp.]